MHDVSKKAYIGTGKIINSDFLNNLNTEEAKLKVIEKLVSKKIGKQKISFRLKDWGISRQRYWGCPIPMIYLEDGSVVPLLRAVLMEALSLSASAAVEATSSSERPYSPSCVDTAQDVNQRARHSVW